MVLKWEIRTNGQFRRIFNKASCYMKKGLKRKEKEVLEQQEV